MNDPGDPAIGDAIASLIRESRRNVLATLIRQLGDFEIAEDAVQEACLKALERWPSDGVPENPTAWLRVVARNRAIDQLRRDQSREKREALVMAVPEQQWSPELPDPTMLRDDLLRLLFTCCHPTLSMPSRVALALRTLCGLSENEIARALLSSPDAVAKRLVRARQKIKHAKIPYRVPSDHELVDRWDGVLATVYLMFNEGYSATAGPEQFREDLCDQSVRLAELLVELAPDDAAAAGLLALFRLQLARVPARFDADGRPVLMPEQDRTLWDQELIRAGVEGVGRGLRIAGAVPNTYLVQAAIAGCHSLARTWAETDWDAIVSWYDVLLTLDRSPVVALNRAVAVGERDGAATALALVDAIEGLESYPLWHATRAILLERVGQRQAAELARSRALALPMNEPSRLLVLER